MSCIVEEFSKQLDEAAKTYKGTPMGIKVAAVREAMKGIIFDTVPAKANPSIAEKVGDKKYNNAKTRSSYVSYLGATKQAAELTKVLEEYNKDVGTTKSVDLSSDFIYTDLNKISAAELKKMVIFNKAMLASGKFELNVGSSTNTFSISPDGSVVIDLETFTNTVEEVSVLHHELVHAATYSKIETEMSDAEVGSMVVKFMSVARKAFKNPNKYNKSFMRRLQYILSQESDQDKLAEMFAIIASEPAFRSEAYRVLVAEERNVFKKVLAYVRRILNADYGIIKEVLDTVDEAKKNYLSGVTEVVTGTKTSFGISNIVLPSVSETLLNKEPSSTIADILVKLYPEIKVEYTTGTKELKSKADIEAGTILINSLLQSQGTLPQEYARHYISWFSDAPIVKEAVRKWGSEEALIQAIGEQAIIQKGEAYGWWKTFSKWVKTMFDSFDSLEKEGIKNVLTDSFLSRYNLSAIATRKDSNYELNELFLDSVKNRYREYGIESNIDEFVDYADSVFPNSQLQDIYKHDTNIVYSSAYPSYNMFMQNIYDADQSIKDQAKEVFNKYKREVTTVLRDYKRVKENRGNLRKVPLILSNNKGLVVTGVGRSFGNGKETIMGQLGAYATIPGYVVYINTDDMSEHTLNIRDTLDTKKPYAEREQTKKELAKTLEGSNIIIKQIKDGGMMAASETYYVADAANKFIQARKKIAENLSRNGFEEASRESSHYVLEAEFLTIVDTLMLNKGVDFVLRQNDIVQYILENLESNIFMHNIMKGFQSIEEASSLSKTIENELKPLISSVGQDMLDSQNKKKQWMYNGGFQEHHKGKNFNVSDDAYFFGEVGQAKWGNGNTTFLAKLNVTANEKGHVGAIPNISDAFRAQNDKYPIEAVVETTQQIHIFGSDNDIKMFKGWKNKQANTKQEASIIQKDNSIKEMTPQELIEKALECGKGK